jgi:streptogramin lyase
MREMVLKCLGTVFLSMGLAEGQVSFTQYSLPFGSWPSRITAGPDGAMWFTQTGKIGRISLRGEITDYVLPTLTAPLTIVPGPDGALWFTEPFIPKIGRITTSGNITEFTLPTAALVFSITSGPDGALWFTAANQIGRITTAGSVTMFSLPPSHNQLLDSKRSGWRFVVHGRGITADRENDHEWHCNVLRH